MNINTVKLDVFKTAYLPSFEEKGIPVVLISNKKSYNRSSNIVSIFEREIPSNTEHIFLDRNGLVYQLNRKLQKSDFFKVGDFSPMWKGVFDETNFGPVLPTLLGERKELTPKPVDQPPSYSFDEVQTPAAESEPALFDKPVEAPALVLQPVVKPLHEHGTGTSEGWIRFLDKRLGLIQESMVKKGVEYHRGANPFHNFDTTGRMNKQIPERALWGMVSKQITSTLDLIEDMEQGKLPSPEMIQEKTGDCVNYMLLLQGLMLRTLDQQAA